VIGAPSRRADFVLAIVGSLVAIVTVARAGGGAELPTHPAQLAPLSVDGSFPRFTAEELASAGYPDHKHAFAYPGYEPPITADGETYGVYSLARGADLKPREGLVVAPGEIRYRAHHLSFDPELEAVGRMPLMEVLDWAEREVTALLGHARTDTLHVADPRDLDVYRERTGYEFHRLYWRDGDRAVVEPAQVLFARGLALHAAFHLQTVWQLEGWLGAGRLPRWFSEGLASYLAEDGVHYLSYLGMYRADGPVVLGPDETERILAAPPLADRELDKKRYRMASYSAYLMMWELVENRGGLGTLRTFLERVAAGEDGDRVASELYGHGLAELAAELDATARPEPVGDAIQPRSLNRPPGP
jgi:hypothetical protein